MRIRTLLLLIAAMALIFAASCGDDPTTPEKEEDGTEWPDMTSQDDVIKVIVLAYNDPKYAESISKYRDLLHSQYFFGFHENDIEPGESPILSRSEDIASTEWIFNNSTLLELTITPEIGSWATVDMLNGEACADCWEATRNYFIRAQFDDEGTIFQSPPERAFARFIVAPDESDASKWVLRAMYDLGL